MAPPRPASQSLFARALDLARCRLRAGWYLRNIDAQGRGARLRNSVHVHNDGTIRLGERVCVHAGPTGIELTALAGGIIDIGDDVMINYGCSFNASSSIRIGNRCRFGINVTVLDCDLHMEAVDRRAQRPLPEPVEIEDDVWVASRAIILPGVRLGRGCIVGAGSVVTRSVPAGMVALGNPARVARPIAAGGPSAETLQIDC